MFDTQPGNLHLISDRQRQRQITELVYTLKAGLQLEWDTGTGSLSQIKTDKF